MASSACDLQLLLGMFAGECEAAGIRINTSKSEAMVLRRKPVEEFGSVGFLYTSDGKMEREIDCRIGAAGAVLSSLYHSVMTKRELSHRANLSVYRSIFVSTLTYGHEGWVMTDRSRSRIQAADEINVKGGWTLTWR